MIFLKRSICRLAVCQLIFPFFVQVLAQLVLSQCPLLLLDSTNLRILYGLSINSDQLHAEVGDGTQAPQSVHPCQKIGQTTKQRRRKPAWGPAAVEKTSLPIASMSLSPVAAHHTPRY